MFLPAQISRRAFLRAGCAWGCLGPATLTAGGDPVGEFGASFDLEMENFMRARAIPGGALAVAKDFRLVYARGYGWADREKRSPVQPASLFRLASVSKPITAVVVLRLAQSGKLKLDDKAFEWLRLDPLPGSKLDPRWREITVRHLLHHTGGWDSKKSGDPMFMSERIARAAGGPRPPGAETIIRYMLGQPLDFDPGTRHAYSNFGYCLLGRVIERVTGRSYGEWVRHDLAPAGLRDLRLGRSLAAEAAPGEVHYYLPNNEQGPSVFAAQPGRVPQPYGTFALEAMDAHGGWVGSAVDLMRLVVALEDRRRGPLLDPAWFQQMIAPPPAPVARRADGAVEEVYYGCGWLVRRLNRANGVNLWHTGSLPGTFTLLVRLAGGLSWAALFNQRQSGSQLPDGEIDGALHRAAAAVKTWPEQDLFGRYSSPE